MKFLCFIMRIEMKGLMIWHAVLLYYVIKQKHLPIQKSSKHFEVKLFLIVFNVQSLEHGRVLEMKGISLTMLWYGLRFKWFAISFDVMIWDLIVMLWELKWMAQWYSTHCYARGSEQKRLRIQNSSKHLK